MGGALEEITQATLLFRGQFVDAREISEACACLLPERSGIVEKFGGNAGNKRSRGGWPEPVQRVGGEHLTGTLFALHVHQTKIGSRGPHAREQVLHDEAAPSHGTQHPLLRLERNRLKSFGVEAIGGRQRLGLQPICFGLCEIHGTLPSCCRAYRQKRTGDERRGSTGNHRRAGAWPCWF